MVALLGLFESDLLYPDPQRVERHTPRAACRQGPHSSPWMPIVAGLERDAAANRRGKPGTPASSFRIWKLSPSCHALPQLRAAFEVASDKQNGEVRLLQIEPRPACSCGSALMISVDRIIASSPQVTPAAFGPCQTDGVSASQA
jgi:hypothetical protein